MNLLLVGVNHRSADVAIRERLAVAKAELPVHLQQLGEQLNCDVVCVSTCNRVEWYLHGDVRTEPFYQWLSNCFGLSPGEVAQSVYCRHGLEAVEHLFRVVASLDSIVLGEAQIAGQVKEAYEQAQAVDLVSPLLHLLFQHARQVAKRIRKETQLTAGKVSVSSLAIDYLMQVFDHFSDKTVLVIGTGKIGELTLRHLQSLGPGQILICNRSHEKAEELAQHCRGQAIHWHALDDAMIRSDIILSTTGAPEPIMPLARMQKLLKSRQGRHWAIIDLAIPRDFDPRIADLDEVDLLVNIDDFKAIRENVLLSRMKHVPEAEAIVGQETERFAKSWSRRFAGPAIARLNSESDAIRMEVEQQCLSKLNGQLCEQDRETIRGALRLLQNKLLHKPIAVLQEEAKRGQSGGLIEAIVKLFRLGD